MFCIVEKCWCKSKEQGQYPVVGATPSFSTSPPQPPRLPSCPLLVPSYPVLASSIWKEFYVFNLLGRVCSFVVLKDEKVNMCKILEKLTSLNAELRWVFNCVVLN